jgi:hypothetical protein
MRKILVHISRVQSQEEVDNAEYAAWGMRGTKPEFIVWKYLVRNKHLKPDVDFSFQSSMFGGRRIFGGMVLDFYIPALNMAWRVQGEEFHLLLTKDRVHDKITRIQLEQRGMVVVDLWVRDLLSRPLYVLDLAWQGHEVVGPIDD